MYCTTLLHSLRNCWYHYGGVTQQVSFTCTVPYQLFFRSLPPSRPPHAEVNLSFSLFIFLSLQTNEKDYTSLSLRPHQILSDTPNILLFRATVELD